MGSPARWSARSNARPKSRWLVNRSRPRLAYRSRSFCTGGGCWGGWSRTLRRYGSRDECPYCSTFHGDYLGLDYGSDNKANMVWTDMRDKVSALVADRGQYLQFVYFARR